MTDISAIIIKIEELETLLADTDFSSALEVQNKLSFLLELSKNRLKSQYTIFLPSPNRDQMINYLSSLITHIKNYKNSKNAQYIQHIEANISNIIPIVNLIPFLGKGETAAGLSKILESYQNKFNNVVTEIDQAKKDFSTNTSSLQKTIEGLSKKLSEKETQIENLTTSFQGEFLKAQQDQLKEFNDQVKEFRETFENNQKTRNETFIENQSTRNTEFLEGQAEREKEFLKLKNKLGNESNDIILSMQKLEKDTKSIYDFVVSASLGGEQKKHADAARLNATILFWVAIVFMVIAALIVGWPILMYLKAELGGGNSIDLKQLNLGLIFHRFIVGIMFLLPAFYLASESKRQRNKENEYRELQIKLMSIPPYFSPEFSIWESENAPEEKDKVKLELAQKLLSPSQKVPEDNIVIPKDALDLIKTLVHINSVGLENIKTK